MTISEDRIMKHLDMLMTGSKPGDALHELHVIAAPRDAINALGVVDEGRLDLTIYAIAAEGGPFEADKLVNQTIMTAAVQAYNKVLVPLFAVIGWETWWVDPGDKAADDLAASILKQGGLLSEHPDAVEVTAVYGASRDGRRWRGRHYLTGPKAGTSADVDTLVGLPHRSEGFGLRGATHVRRLVGIHA